MKPCAKVKCIWAPRFAYAIGLLTTDGNLSPDGRHINFTSKDLELAKLFKYCLKLDNKIGKKRRGYEQKKKYFVVQFGDRIFYDFLLSLGLMPNKSKIVGALKVPRKYFSDFLRGCLDGDGNIHFFKHPESQRPQLRIRLSSASKRFLMWIRKMAKSCFKLKGGWVARGERCWILCYGISDSLKLLKFIYNDIMSPRLRRKYLIAKRFLRA